MTKSINPNMYNALEKERDDLLQKVAKLESEKAELIAALPGMFGTGIATGVEVATDAAVSAFEEYPEDEEADDDGA
jgi:hypothetical protein